MTEQNTPATYVATVITESGEKIPEDEWAEQKYGPANFDPADPHCPVCGGEISTVSSSCWVTAVGYSSPQGHHHDDNCRKHEAGCAQGHRFVLAARNSCGVRMPDGSACTWKGKERCFCLRTKGNPQGLLVEKMPRPVAQWP